MTTRAIFLDRDGTVNEEVGYLESLDRFKLFPGVPAAIARANRAGVKVFVLTNQSGVGRGYFSIEFVQETHRHLQTLLKREGAHLDGIYLCPHHPDDRCSCRKPEIRMMADAAGEHGVDLSRSWVVGDKLIDMEMAHRAGAKGVLVLTGYGEEEIRKIPEAESRETMSRPDHVARDLSEAIDLILNEWRRETEEAGKVGDPACIKKSRRV